MGGWATSSLFFCAAGVQALKETEVSLLDEGRGDRGEMIRSGHRQGTVREGVQRERQAELREMGRAATGQPRDTGILSEGDAALGAMVEETM